MNKLLVICGPTATGKTAIAIKLAKKFKGELISADSRQVYKWMDIGTGKDHPSGFKIHLIDVAKPDEKFSVADYVGFANLVIKDVWERGKLPIVVGGTGFYIKGLIEGIETMGIEPDWELRKKLSNYPIIKLSNCLKKLDLEKWKKLNESDIKNPRRLIRAIEIAMKELPQGRRSIKMDTLLIGLRASYEFLYQRIDKRVDERIKKGVEEEISNLLKRGYSWKNSVMGATIGYREWQPYFEKKEPKDSVIQRWKFAEHNYARRQMTWFRKNKEIYWFDIANKNWQTEVENLVAGWYTQF